MEMKISSRINFKKINSRAILWVLIAFYTYILPNFRIIYNSIVSSFGQAVAGKVPLVFVLIIGMAYVIALFRTHKSLKNLLYLVPAAVIAATIMVLQPNPNKHIHIPQYVLMAWLLFAVLSKDIKGKELFILIFLLGSVLGVVDELEQGVHPTRFYGWSDMLVNSASTLIGVFTIMGLNKAVPPGVDWLTPLKESKAVLWFILFGLVGAVIMCATLFQVAASEIFWGVYPQWLLSWNILFVLIVPAMIYTYQRSLRKQRYSPQDQPANDLPPEVKEARLWIVPPLVILFYMHIIVIYVAYSGAEFI